MHNGYGICASVLEDRVEVVAPARLRAQVLAAIRASHPYEEPAFDVVPLAALPAGVGIGRIGTLAEPLRFADFVARVDAVLPQTTWGVRAAGDPDAPVARVAVCGGAGDSLLGAAAAAGVDAYVTADLRHHPADEHRRASGVALVDVAHWASEYPWCTQAAALLRNHFGAALPVAVCDLRTDPWNIESICERHVVKAEVAQQRSLLELAELDAELARLTHRAANLPEQQSYDTVQADHREAGDRLAALAIALEDIDAQVTRFESEIDGVRQREDRDRKLLDSGTVNPKQLEELQHELETLERRQASLEDSLLEVMERLEQLAGDQSGQVAKVDALQGDLAAAGQARDEALAEIEQVRGERTARRDEIVAGLDSGLVAALRTAAGGIGCRCRTAAGPALRRLPHRARSR